jgi:hypothetical protein
MILGTSRGSFRTRTKSPASTATSGSAQKFVVPEGFLRPGKEYRLGLGTVARGGNASFLEATFTTMGGKD